jgi:hypothetical protein
MVLFLAVQKTSTNPTLKKATDAAIKSAID